MCGQRYRNGSLLVFLGGVQVATSVDAESAEPTTNRVADIEGNVEAARVQAATSTSALRAEVDTCVQTYLS